MPLRPGEIVGSYEVVRRIGGGSSAEVFEVVHTTLKSRHALKVLQRQWVEDADLRARFLAEGKLQAGFRSPHLARVTDTLAEPGIAALVLDLLDGETLRDRIERSGRIPWQQAVTWAQEALAGLRVAHAAGVVHRDIKPENLYLDRSAGEERLVVIDFGIAKAGENRTTQAGTLGTCAYMSPEQVRDAGTVDPRTDLFAVGTVLWEMLVGHPAFEGTTAFASMQAVLDTDPGPPSAKNSDVPGWLDGVVMRALAKAPDDRFPDVDAFSAALREQQGVPKRPSPPVRSEREATPGRGLGFYLLVALFGFVGLGALGMAGIAGLAWWFRPPAVHGLEVTSDDCGAVTIAADVYARNADVAFFVDAREVFDVPGHGGRSVLTHTTKLTQGSTVQVRVEAGSADRQIAHTVAGQAPRLTIHLPQGAREGQLDVLRTDLQGTCLPTGLTYEAVAGGRRSTGPIGPGQSIGLDVSGLPAGRHAVEVRVLSGDALVTQSNATLFVGERPPPNDQDLDGHETPGDCNDHDPTVHPGREEASHPNGVDDNCDGRIDEGTEVYDDDGDGLSEQDGDCNDDDRHIRPGVRELPDCRDQDCDGEIDEGVELAQRDDRWEPNDSREQARDLATGSKRAFSQDLELVFTSTQDEAWFTFRSDDGGWDDWGIDVTGVELPEESSFVFEVWKGDGLRRGQLLVEEEGEMLAVRGRPFRDDSGMYQLRIQPTRLAKPWCPAKIRLVSR